VNPADDTANDFASSVAQPASFASFGLHPDILRALTEQGYTHPTPIQEQAIPVVLAGRDVMGAAQTGTGKTAGFALPILQKLLPLASSSTSPARHPVRALILVPTRELADQVYENVARYGQYTPLKSTVVFGGMDMTPQTTALRAGVEILIATPGRLLDHVQQKTLNLGQVQVLVLDEADRMLDMGFLPDLQRIINLLPKQRQNLMFSATFSNEIKKLANTFMNEPQLIETARRNATAENVTQVVYQVASEHKRAAVAHIVRERGMKQVIVFSNTKIGTSRLARELIKEGIKADAIHGDKSQKERMLALEAFKKGEIDVLVATDVAARGLDIAELPCVINYDLPHAPEDYVHRIGRTGRAGASGDAISLMAPDEERYLLDIEKLTKKKVERRELEGFQPGERVPHQARSEGPETRAERGPRDERGDRGDRGERSKRRESGAFGDAGERQARPSRPFPAKAKPVDEWFLKPYESKPQASPQNASATPADSAAKPSISRAAPRKAVAALLGGSKKS
jgi:superfamily II DNA/RNA helicase